MSANDKSTVYLSNLSYRRDRNGLKALLAPYGTIRHIKIVVEPTTQQSRGMAFIEMSSAEQTKAAIQGLDQKSVDGRLLKARYATPLKSAHAPKPVAQAPVKKEKDLDYKRVQLMKKERNDRRRNALPF